MGPAHANLSVEGDVIVGHLADPVLVDTDDLLVIVRSKTKEGDKVEQPADGGGDDERVGGTGDGVGELVTDLDPVLVEPSTSNLGTVKGGLSRKKRGKDQRVSRE